MQRSYSRKKDPVSSLEYISTTLFGDELLNLPALNKGSAFSKEERETLGLLGRLPNDISSLERQLERAYESYKKEPTNLTKYSFLMSLMERNETLFFALASGHIAEMLPILYTPTVGDAVKRFSHIFQKPPGLFISGTQSEGRCGYSRRDGYAADFGHWRPRGWRYRYSGWKINRLFALRRNMSR